jgi:hypothetical protein
MKDIGKEIADYYDKLLSDPNDRFLSWEHCYRFFQSKPTDYDLASLHLAFYLASWGMYRGSSFLLQKDYRIHLAVVENILNPRYFILNGLSFEKFFGRQNEVTDTLFDLLNWVKACYKNNTTLQHGLVNVTDTLATKILLGTLGCMPAYDRFVIRGLKEKGLSFSYLNKKNFLEMMRFCSNHREEFRQAQAHVSKRGFEYPLMKIIDTYFWRVGERIDEGSI